MRPKSRAIGPGIPVRDATLAVHLTSSHFILAKRGQGELNRVCFYSEMYLCNMQQPEYPRVVSTYLKKEPT
jgi:hypothetical protein